MYEEITYENIIERMLDKVPDTLDKREGSVIYDALAPAALELQQVYMELDVVLNETFADTATREYLERRTREHGVIPYAATRAVLRGVFTPENVEIPIGSRFTGGDCTYVVKSKIIDGMYQMECESEGAIGNSYFGTLIPIDYINGLETATLTEVLIPGEEEEDTEHLRERFYNSMDIQAFGGNKADYKEKVTSLTGVGGVKVYRAWSGSYSQEDIEMPAAYHEWLENMADIPEEIRQWLKKLEGACEEGILTVGGGVVRLVIISSSYKQPTDAVIEMVQTSIAPEQNQGDGEGIAPIGHVVHVEGVREEEIHINTTVALEEGWTWEAIRPYIELAADEYLQGLAEEWADSDNLVVRISQLEPKILTLPNVVDISGTTINGISENIILEADSIPVRGDVSGQTTD